MSNLKKIEIDLSDEILNAVDRERKVSGESRSEFLGRAAKILVRWQKESVKQNVPATKESWP
jgi:metal-responsive CopG/Arc/MetJ family transcriptional regulator